jgi:iron complex outermembrane receptor protein
LKGTKIQVEGEYTARQNNWDAESEWLAPPDSYILFSIKWSTGIKLKSHTLHIGLGVENVFDISYRNYLNRLRYFSEETGRSIQVQAGFDF